MFKKISQIFSTIKDGNDLDDVYDEDYDDVLIFPVVQLLALA